MRIRRRCGYSAATRPRLSHMPAMMSCDPGFRKLGQRAADVEPGAFGDAEPGADRARQCAADRRRPIDRQQSERAKAQRRSPALQSVGETDELPRTRSGPSPASLSRHFLPQRGRGGTKPSGAWWVKVASRSVGTGGHAPTTPLSIFASAAESRQRISTSRTSIAALFAAGTRTMSFAVVMRRACARSAARSSRSISPARYG